MIAVLLAFAILTGEPTPPTPPAPAPVAQNLITKPTWIRRPTAYEMVDAYPRRAWRQGVSGRSTLVCRIRADGTLTACEAKNETPAGEGFGEAVLKLAPRFQMAPTTDEGGSVEGAVVMIPVVWHPPR